MAPSEVPEFKQWVEQYHRDREFQHSIIQTLSKDVASLTADVRNLLENQKNIVQESHRPFQWGAFVSAIVGVVVFAGLLTSPMYKELQIHHNFDDRVVEHMIKDAEEMGWMRANSHWLEKSTDNDYRHHTDEWRRLKQHEHDTLEQLDESEQ